MKNVTLVLKEAKLKQRKHIAVKGQGGMMMESMANRPRCGSFPHERQSTDVRCYATAC
jgi:hypothetical protein